MKPLFLKRLLQFWVLDHGDSVLGLDVLSLEGNTVDETNVRFRAAVIVDNVLNGFVGVDLKEIIILYLAVKIGDINY